MKLTFRSVIYDTSFRFAVSFSLLILVLAACTSRFQSSTPSHSSLHPATITNLGDSHSKENQNALDLQEANVVAVTFEALGNGNYRFDVTLHHDDDGEAPNFADYWQVEDLDGMILGKRVLTHSHNSEPFTRSEIIAIPEKISNVIVRGHDMNHGFGGQVMKIDLLTGKEEAFIE